MVPLRRPIAERLARATTVAIAARAGQQPACLAEWPRGDNDGSDGNTYQFAASSVMVDDANLLVMRRETADGLLQLPEAPVLLSGPLQFSLKGRLEVRL